MTNLTSLSPCPLHYLRPWSVCVCVFTVYYLTYMPETMISQRTSRNVHLIFLLFYNSKEWSSRKGINPQKCKVDIGMTWSQRFFFLTRNKAMGRYEYPKILRLYSWTRSDTLIKEVNSVWGIGKVPSTCVPGTLDLFLNKLYHLNKAEYR